MQDKDCEPIAIIGMGCRFPGGAKNPEAFWELLRAGTDAIADVPADRWDLRRFYDPDPDKAGKTYARQGGFLKEKIDRFDPLFFGISPREAESMDPQQRLLLEVTWEAFEDAGLPAENLLRSPTGVFIGGFCMDNQLLKLGGLNRELADAYTPASSSMTVLSNRISHVFDLRGPSLTIDTACSSSLVAAHYACLSLWAKECELAITGGVNVMLRPDFSIIMSKGRFLSEHSRCMAFDERASGYARGEGAGAVILKPLARAQADGDPIHAVIRASGVNQDGRTTGISLPNPDAQETLIRDVYRRAGVPPKAIDYVEAHGTGTQVGDPAEIGALQKVLSEGRAKDRKCIVGTVKTNFGHLEAAAGVAGLMKTALCLEHGEIPPNLHFQKPNPKIPFHNLCLRVPTELEKWPEKEGPAFAAVNSFGYGGTNAHILMEAYSEKGRKESEDSGKDPEKPFLVPLSARSEQALSDLAGRYAFHLTVNSEHLSLPDFAYTVSQRRSHHNHRLAVLAETKEELREHLLFFSSGEVNPGISVGRTGSESGTKLVFVFTGMGPQWWGMGRQLRVAEPVFKTALEECFALFEECADWSLEEAWGSKEADSRLAEPQVAQPANFALQVALCKLWESWGIKPDAVVGHSVGEVAAAWLCGALSLRDAIAVGYHRSRLQQKLSGMGAMLAVALTEAEVRKHIEGKGISIAAVNGPSSLTLSGRMKPLRTLAGVLEKKAIFNRLLKVDVAYHGEQMDGIKEELLASLREIETRPANRSFYSAVSGGLLEETILDNRYWWKNVREPVRFGKCVRALLEDGYRDFLEIGPHPVLKNAILEGAENSAQPVNLFHSLRRKTPEPATILQSLGKLYTLGSPVRWKAVLPRGGCFISLPHYPWQRERYWRESDRSREDRMGNPGHPFFNTDLRAPYPAWEVEINDQFFPWLKDHRVRNKAVFPGAAFVEAGLAIHEKIFASRPCVLEDLRFHSMLTIEEDEIQFLGLSYNPENKKFSVHSRRGEMEVPWQENASGRIIHDPTSEKEKRIDLAPLQSRFQKAIPVETFYGNLEERNLNYRESFQSVEQLWVEKDEFLIRIKRGKSTLNPRNLLILHPAVLDAAFQSVLALDDHPFPFIPISIARVRFYGSGEKELWGHGKIVKRGRNSLRADLMIFDDSGKIVAEIRGLDSTGITFGEAPASKEIYYTFKWEERALPNLTEKKRHGNWLIFSGLEDEPVNLMDSLKEKDFDYAEVVPGNSNRISAPRHYELSGTETEDFTWLFSATKEQVIENILYLWSWKKDNPSLKLDFQNVIDETMAVVNLVKGFQTIHGVKSLSLFIVTEDAQAVDKTDTCDGFESSPLGSLGQLLTNEFPNIKCRVIDFGTNGNSQFKDNLFKEITSNNSDTDVAYRSDRRFVQTLNRFSFKEEAFKADGKIISTDKPVVLHLASPGQLDSLYYKEIERKPPESNEVEIQVEVTALNFKDLLKAYGKFSSNLISVTFFAEELGMEFSGVITRLGKKVKKFKVGDEIVAFNPGSFRSYINVPVDFVVSKPNSLELDKSPIYISFVTAYYGLISLADLKRDESILIHNATGALGLAAIQVAKWVGAEIFGTAGNHDKRAYLKSLGINNPMDSRTLNFASEIKKLTHNRGVDVVINATTGEALYKSFELLKPYGRFIEVGKRDILENNGLPMRAFNRNLSFAAVDIDRMYLERPAIIRQIIEKINRCFDAGYFKALPTKVFRAENIPDAFRFMAQRKHIGKIVVKMREQKIPILKLEKENRGIIRNNSTYLITGGTRGFGLEVAKWLAGKGAEQLVLASRSGASLDEAKEAVASMEAGGTKVLTLSVDVAEEPQVETLIETIKNDLPPLRGIFHAAMVLDDGILLDMNEERMRTVMRPKVAGALLLHQFTMDMPLDYFVCFSSISSLVGNPGQANYVAANTFLDSFAHYRRGRGLPATTINWGMFAETGVTARDPTIARQLENRGLSGLTTRRALDGLETVLVDNPVQIGIFEVDWKRLAQFIPNETGSSRFRNFIGAGAMGEANPEKEKRGRLIKDLSAMKETDRQAYMEKILREQLSVVLRFPLDKIDVRQSLGRFGIDSLSVVELRMTLKRNLGIEIESQDLLKGPSIAEFAAQELKKLLPHIIESGPVPAMAMAH